MFFKLLSLSLSLSLLRKPTVPWKRKQVSITGTKHAHYVCINEQITPENNTTKGHNYRRNPISLARNLFDQSSLEMISPLRFCYCIVCAAVPSFTCRFAFNVHSMSSIGEDNAGSLRERSWLGSLTRKRSSRVVFTLTFVG